MHWLPKASSLAATVDRLGLYMLILSGAIVVIVWVLMIYFCLRYHETSDKPNQNWFTGKTEWWIAGGIFIFGLCTFIASAKNYYHLYTPPKDATEVDVIAKQWMWIFHTPGGEDQINRLKVAIHKPVRLVMTSEDVIHSFFVPAFRIKQDVLPGRYTSLWFEPTQLGEYQVLCTQYCGTDHSKMLATIEVVEEKDLPVEANASGRNLFHRHGCESCHFDHSSIAPSLNGVYGSTVRLSDGSQVRADDNYIRQSILSPASQVVSGFQPVMPSFQGQLTEQEIGDLIDYIRHLKAEKP